MDNNGTVTISKYNGETMVFCKSKVNAELTRNVVNTHDIDYGYLLCCRDTHDQRIVYAKASSPPATLVEPFAGWFTHLRVVANRERYFR